MPQRIYNMPLEKKFVGPQADDLPLPMKFVMPYNKEPTETDLPSDQSTEDVDTMEQMSIQDQESDNNAPMTTLKVCNIRLRHTQEQLLRDFDQADINLLYLPYNFRQRRTTGYAFINFLTAEAAVKFREKWHGKYLPSEEGRQSTTKGKPLEVVYAAFQGFEANMSLWRTSLSRTIDAALLPVVKVTGHRVGFHQYLSFMEHCEWCNKYGTIYSL